MEWLTQVWGPAKSQGSVYFISDTVYVVIPTGVFLDGNAIKVFYTISTFYNLVMEVVLLIDWILFLVIVSVYHLSGWNSIFKLASQFSKVWRSCCKRAASLSDFTVRYAMVSSAKRCTVERRFWGRSFM